MDGQRGARRRHVAGSSKGQLRVQFGGSQRQLRVGKFGCRCSEQEYFGQYGKIMKVQLNSAPSSTPGPPSLSCHITYSNRDEAEQVSLPSSAAAALGFLSPPTQA